MKISKLGWLYVALLIASVIIFSCIWRWLDNGFVAILLIIYPIVYFIAGYFATLFQDKSKGRIRGEIGNV